MFYSQRILFSQIGSTMTAAGGLFYQLTTRIKVKANKAFTVFFITISQWIFSEKHPSQLQDTDGGLRLAAAW